jgi:hypothetical protein
MKTQLDKFTLAYIEAALWSTNDESTPRGGEPLDANYSIDDIAPVTLATMVADCKEFQRVCGVPSYNNPLWSNAELAGHDFWLTRNGHGSGFWDGDLPEDVSDRLTAASHEYGEFDLYVGDDGAIHA